MSTRHNSDMLLVRNGPWLVRAKLYGISCYQRAGGASRTAGNEIPPTWYGKNAPSDTEQIVRLFQI